MTGPAIYSLEISLQAGAVFRRMNTPLNSGVICSPGATNITPELEEDAPTEEATGRAEEAVQRRKAAGSAKSPTAIWAAIKALAQFVEGQEDRDREVLQDIIMEIIKLTDFLEENFC